MIFRDKEKLAELQQRLKEAGVENVFWNVYADDACYWMLPDDDKVKIANEIVNTWAWENIKEEMLKVSKLPFKFDIPLSVGYKYTEWKEDGFENLAT